MADTNDKIILALIGAGARGTQLILSTQENCSGVEVKYVCDVDKGRGGRAISVLKKRQKKKPKYVEDMRHVYDDKDVNAVIIATPEHWHALATVWACQAGKDVYVEKNISLSISEGEKMIEAAKKYNRIIQCGTQNRSALYSFSARDYIQSGKLGKIVLVKTYCMLPGGSPWILKPNSEIPEGLNWDLWLGPASMVPYNVSRHKAWYDWWAYSGGQVLAGDASHVLDLARMVIGDPDFPNSVYCAGGRVLFDDNREVPDYQTITFDYGNFLMTCESSKYGNYLSKTSTEIRHGNLFPNWQLNSTRIEIYGTEAMMYLGRHGGGWQVIGNDSQVLDEEYGYFPDEAHQQNFLESVRTRKIPNGDIKQGHCSANLVHLANLSYRAGKKHLLFDGKKITNSEEANFLDNRIYREGYEIAEVINE
ncbi:gfo/Idh/MocA family oxidoreductase [Mariniphaga sediminis]|uniref:Gfo/Idh/MocA family oxidoreductase n=1 Tax=Mariniphaga sediminis TaxID=1628158 RepID=A0A399D527_9BACT|nr:Gfo/Idh/MocA family oxidoreductase [Mariniphaga sediminis]RIH67005.1 gfo/Idh/MocA family oxidoreductase [Mariniphaga sediminis]